MLQQELYNVQPTRAAYRELRRHSNFAGLCFLGTFALQEVLVVILVLFGFNDAFSTNLAFQYAVSALPLTIFAMAFPFFLYSLRKGRASYFKALPFSSPAPFGKLFLIIIAGFGLCIISNYVANLFGIVFSFTGLEPDLPEQATSSNSLDVFMNFVASAAVAPLIEEFVFRGVLMQPLRRYGDRFAIIASSVIFALAHGRPANIVFAFLAGIILGCAVVYTRSLWVGIVIHALHNGLSVFFVEMENIAPEFANTAYLTACAVVSVAGVVAFIIYAKKYGLRLNRDTSGLSAGRRFCGFFLTVPMIFTVLYYLFNVVINLLTPLISEFTK